MQIILDMDECLIHSQFLSGNEYRQYEDRAHEQKSTGDKSCEKFSIELPDGDVVLVNKRPGLDEFLRKVSERWETRVFTAALSVYAGPVLDALDPVSGRERENILLRVCWGGEGEKEGGDPLLIVDVHVDVVFRYSLFFLCSFPVVPTNPTTQQPNNHLPQPLAPQDDEIFTARHYRESCTVHPSLGVYVKDLSQIIDDQDLTRVVLVDNNPMSFLSQPGNGVLVSNFYDDPDDETLPAVLGLLEEIDELRDVRPKLNKMFGLREALEGVTKGKRT